MRRQIVRNVGSNYLVTAMGVAFGFFLIPFLIHKLGKEAFGLIVLAESTIALFEVATVSVRMALGRFAAFSLAREGKKEFAEYLSTGRSLLFISAALVFVSGVLLAHYFPVIFRMPADLTSESQRLFFLITLAFSVSIPNSVFWSVLYARQRFDLINFSLSLGLVARAVGLFVLYSVLPVRYVTLTTYGLVYVGMTLVQNFLIYFQQRRIMPDVHIRLGGSKRDKVWEILSFSFHTSVSRVSSLLSNDALNVLINLFWGAASNTIYSLGVKFPLVMNRLFLEGTWTLTPTFTELVAKNEKEKLKRLYFGYTKFVAIIVIPLVLFLVVMAASIIRFWVGEGFEEAAELLSILAFPLLAALPLAVSGCVLNAYGRVKLPSRMSFLAAVVNVALGMFLGKVFSLGLVGMALSTASASFFYYTLFMPSYACRVAGISLAEYWGSFLKPFGWSVLVMGASLWFLKTSHDGVMTLPFLLASAVSLPLLSYVGAYFTVLTPEEKTHVKETFQETIGIRIMEQLS